MGKTFDLEKNDGAKLCRHFETNRCGYYALETSKSLL